jgi:very-short-patch-repair endonuclease
MPGVYRSAQWPESLEQLCVATCARNPSALISFTTGLRVWNRRGVPGSDVHSLVTHGASPELPLVVVHRCRRIDDVDIVERPDGIRIASPPRCLFDSADMLGFDRTRSVMEQMLNDRMCTLGTIADTLSRLYHPNRPGSRTLQAVLRSKPTWQRALQSELELRVLREIERQQLPAPITQCPLQLPDGTTIHLDFGWPQWKVGLEVDDPAWHDGALESQRDARRDRKATMLGWAVPRITRLDVDARITEAVSDVAVILGARDA